MTYNPSYFNPKYLVCLLVEEGRFKQKGLWKKGTTRHLYQWRDYHLNAFIILSMMNAPVDILLHLASKEISFSGWRRNAMENTEMSLSGHQPHNHHHHVLLCPHNLQFSFFASFWESIDHIFCFTFQSSIFRNALSCIVIFCGVWAQS